MNNNDRRHERRNRQRDAADAETEIGGAQRGEEVLARHSEWADRDDQRRHDHREPRQPLHQHDDLLEALAPEAQRRLQALRERGFRPQQPLAALLHERVGEEQRGGDAG